MSAKKSSRDAETQHSSRAGFDAEQICIMKKERKNARERKKENSICIKSFFFYFFLPIVTLGKRLCFTSPTELFAFLELQDPSNDVSELHKMRQFSDFHALNCEIFGQESGESKVTQSIVLY